MSTVSKIMCGLLSIIIVVLIGCVVSQEIHNTNDSYYNVDLEVVAKGGGDDKHMNDEGDVEVYTYTKLILFRMVHDTTKYCQISSRDGYISLTDSLYYNTRVGDIIHYDRLIKSRFFKMTRPYVKRKT